MSNDTAPDPQLAAYRQSIDNIDAALIHILAERFRITQAVGEYKAKTQLPPADPRREQKQIARLTGFPDFASTRTTDKRWQINSSPRDTSTWWKRIMRSRLKPSYPLSIQQT